MGLFFKHKTKLSDIKKDDINKESQVDLLKKKKDEDDEDDGDNGSSYRNKFREMKLLFLKMKKFKKKMKQKITKRKNTKQLNKQKQKELKCINNMLSIIFNSRISISEKIKQLNKVPVISPLIFEFKKEVIIQLKELKTQKAIEKQGMKEGLVGGVLGIKFKSVAKVLSASLTESLMNKKIIRNDLICKKGAQKVKLVHERKRNSRKSTNLLKASVFKTMANENQKNIGHFTAQELQRREQSLENQYGRSIQ